MSNKKNNNNLKKIFSLIISFILLVILGACSNNIGDTNIVINSNQDIVSFDIDDIPEYSGEPYVTINNNIPFFDEEDYTVEVFETYSERDEKKRCGVAYANICKEIMPEDDEERESIGNINPTGWQKSEYDALVEGGSLYNRCHLIGYQLSGENANKENLITGTRYMNVYGMLPFENSVDDYIKEYPKNHVLYRVTPIFEEDNLVATGVQMEAYSVEDNGKGICFNIFVYNVQPGFIIDYATGQVKLEE